VDYTPPTNFYGTDTFQYLVRDDGTPNLDSLLALVTINVSPTNDAPQITAPTPAAFPEDTSLALAFIDILDDTPSGQGTGSLSNVLVDLTASNGTFTVDGASHGVGVTPIAGGVQLSGSVVNINAALNDADSKYTPDEDFNTTNMGAESIDIHVDDLGNIGGSLPGLTASKSVPLTINSVNDPPLLVLTPDPVIVAQSTSAVSHSVPGFVADRWPAGHLPTPSDEAGQTVSITGVTVLADPDDVIAGAGLGVVSINDATGELTFTANGSASGVATVEVATTDDGGPGAEPPATNTQTFTIQVGINQQPLYTFTGNTPGDDIEVDQDTGIHLFPKALDNVYTGTDFDYPFGQSIQNVVVINDNPLLFTSLGQPDFAFTPPDGAGVSGVTPGFGDLGFVLTPGAYGVANVQVTIIDDGGTANGGDNTAEFDFQIIVNQTGGGPGDGFGPVVTAIKVAGGSWDPGYIALFDPIEQAGYPIPTGSAQFTPLPWANAGQLIVEFDEDVRGTGPSGDLLPADFAVVGVNQLAYPIASVDYDPVNFRATLNMASALPVDKYKLAINDANITDADGNALDGEWSDEQSFPSGDLIVGGDFIYSFNFSPGNFDLDMAGDVDIFDLNVLGLAYEPMGTYNPMADSNGDLHNDIFDLNDLGLNYNNTLPSGTPGVATPAPAVAVDRIFDAPDPLAIDQLASDDVADELAVELVSLAKPAAKAFIA
jgi:hypothetical protein